MRGRFIFLGPPGAGKGTLALRAAPLVGVPHISTGGIFRAAIAARSPLGLKVKAVIDSGGLVDDETTIALVRERLSMPDSDGYILDGFPRTIAQAEALSGFSPPGRVINFDIPDDAVIERLSGRLVCGECGFNWHKTHNPPPREGTCGKCGGGLYTREDDRPDAIEKRLEVYRAQTAPLIEYYRFRGLLADINAAAPVDSILAAFQAVI
ncbi:MAG: nucleoside monophosphate kinase [Spirochaetaceae bacterium]|jgi:adenylate kinase|nr:nucleoside monophosphate kinase [Spirochaetaceae bacterium]